MIIKNTTSITTPFYVDKWLIDPSANQIKNGEKEIKLEPKVMAVLICLAQNPGEVIDRKDIEETAWAGLVVGYGSLASAIIKLRKAFGDDTKKRCYIETVSKKGYRLIATVKIFDENKTLSEVPSQLQTNSSKTDALKKNIFIKNDNNKKYYQLLVLLLLIIPLVWLISFQYKSSNKINRSAIPATPVIAVLPFKNLSLDVNQEYYSDGLTADLIVDLSKISKISVIGRNTAFTYKNLDIDLSDAGKTLGVNYIIEGSVRRFKNDLRITAKLVNAKNNVTLWAERYDGTLEDVFDFQDKVIKKIVSSLEITLADVERVRLADKYSNSIKAYDEFLKGWQRLWLKSKDGVFESREYFFKALKLDDTFARAYANLSISYIYDYLNGWSENPQQVLQKANLYADKALLLNDDFPQVHFVKGLAYTFSGKYQEAITEAEKSLALSPNFADGHGLLATTLNYAGEAKRAEIEMLTAMRLNPNYPGTYLVIYGEILFNQYKYKEAIKSFESALERNPEHDEARRWLAAALAIDGQLDEANWQVELLKASGSSISIKKIGDSLPFKDPEQAKHFIEGLHKAGFEE